MLSSNTWSLYKKAFSSAEASIFKATVERGRQTPATRTDRAPEKDDTRSSDSESTLTMANPSNGRIRNQTSSEARKKDVHISKDRALFADPEKKKLLSAANRTDLTESIGTLLSNIQLSALNSQQLDELALLVSERGVVFFRDQDLSPEQQVRLFEHYGPLDTHPSRKEQAANGSSSSSDGSQEIQSHSTWQQNEWHADASFEANPPSYSLVKLEETANIGGDTAWVSQYGLYDGLSKHMKSFLDDLSAVHTSKLQNANVLEAPVVNQHPAVRTHPATGLKALNVTPGSVVGFSELKKKESDKLLEFLEYHINSSDEHTVRFKWEAGSVAMWDNRCAAHKTIPGSYTATRTALQTSCLGEKPFLDPNSESREERASRIAKEAKDEYERIEAAKARFNNTPMRRLIQRQVLGEKVITYADSGYGEETSIKEELVTKEKDLPLATISPNSESRKQRTERWAKTVTTESKPQDGSIIITKNVPEKVAPLKPEVKFNVTPLRRIIQRQVSGGNAGPRRRDWR